MSRCPVEHGRLRSFVYLASKCIPRRTTHASARTRGHSGSGAKPFDDGSKKPVTTLQPPRHDGRSGHDAHGSAGAAAYARKSAIEPSGAKLHGIVFPSVRIAESAAPASQPKIPSAINRSGAARIASSVDKNGTNAQSIRTRNRS